MPALLVAHHRPGFYFRVLQEGEVGAGDDIVKIADGAERIMVADIDALLYLPGPTIEQLQRALRIPALSKGWRSSFQAMLQQDLSSKTTVGNPGLAHEERAPAWPGFRQMRVANINKESESVTSFILAPIDGQPLPVFQAGQFVVVRLLVNPDKPPVLRSYSLSDLPAADHLRISVKSELNGIGSSYLCNRARVGDVLDVSAPRGSFTLRRSQSPVVLLSAGVGATPVMSMLHSLAAEKSQREIWWIYGARNRIEHPFAEESRSLLKQLSRGRRYIVYSRPAATDQVGTDFDAPGHIDTALLEKLGALFTRLPDSTADLSPWNHWRMPVMIGEVGTDIEKGPVLVTVEYAVIAKRTTEFVDATHEYGRIRRRDGAYRWGIFRDTEVADRYLEIFLVNSWAEHLRQHERQTQADRELEQRINSCLSGEPMVRHLIDAYVAETLLGRTNNWYQRCGRI